MKYKIILLLFLLTSLTMSSQKKYSFDYILEYSLRLNETSKIEKIYLLTNSQDDSYSVYLYQDKDRSSDFVIGFENNKGISSYTAIEKSEFFKAETIELSCENLRFSSRKNDKYESSRYVYTNEPDTLINGSLHKHYTMKFSKSRDSKLYKKGAAHYIVENNTEFHKPLELLSISFDAQKTSKIFPNGIAKEVFTTSFDKKSKKFVYKLLQYVKIKKYFIIPENCDPNVPIPLKFEFK
jgi:hypothetical protein